MHLLSFFICFQFSIFWIRILIFCKDTITCIIDIFNDFVVRPIALRPIVPLYIQLPMYTCNVALDGCFFNVLFVQCTFVHVLYVL